MASVSLGASEDDDDAAEAVTRVNRSRQRMMGDRCESMMT